MQRHSRGVLEEAAGSLSSLLGWSAISEPKWSEDPSPLESLQERLAALSGELQNVARHELPGFIYHFAREVCRLSEAGWQYQLLTGFYAKLAL